MGTQRSEGCLPCHPWPPAGLTVEQKSAPVGEPSRARSRSARLRTAAAAGFGRSAALGFWLPLQIQLSLRTRLSRLSFNAEPSIPRIPEHLAALVAWAGWRARVTSTPPSSLSSPPPFPGAQSRIRRDLGTAPNVTPPHTHPLPSASEVPSQQPDHLGKSFVLNSFSC